MTEDADGGTYTLVIAVPDAATVEVGALGEHTFESGWYAYTGSAFGPGGFSRVQRHRDLAAGDRDARHWHVDYLLGVEGAAVEAVVRSPGADIECGVAGDIEGTPTPDFGCSDCDCDSHLRYADDRDALLDSVRQAHRTHRPDSDG